MLLEYGFKNFFSFKEGAVINLRLDKNCPKTISQGKDFTNVIAIKGANASGKTQVLKALEFLKYFVTDSFSLPPESKIPIVAFGGNKEPTSIYCVFRQDKNEITYEVSFTGEKVLSETVYIKNSRKTNVIERIGNEWGEVTAKFSDLKNIKLRSNCSLFASAHQHEIESTQNIWFIFKKIAGNVTIRGLKEAKPSMSSICEMLNGDNDFLPFTVNFLKECDVGIENIEIHQEKSEDGEIRYFPLFLHRCDDELISITAAFESSGTIMLFSYLLLYAVMLKAGGIVLMDELDINLHPDILPKVLDLFVNKKNVNNAQLIFTTHNSEILDFLGKYRVYLTNKKNNESYVYRLDEIPGHILRNDRGLAKIYREGKLGGVPSIEATTNLVVLQDD